MRGKLFYILIGLILSLACERKETTFHSGNQVQDDHCLSNTCALDRIYYKGGKKYLYSGPDTSQHFHISNWELKDNMLRDHGLDRETFQALIQPTYIALSQIPDKYPYNSGVIVVKGKREVRAYPYSLMTYHELINDTIDGKAYFAAYCVLADFAAVYSREICSQVLTFAVSGYTYINPSDSVHAFILWDRETESLWNPIEDRAVSHTLQNNSMLELNHTKWELLNWSELKIKYPNARVLKAGQIMERISSWSKLECEDLPCCS